MAEDRREKRKLKRKRRRFAKFLFNVLILAIILYLIMIGISMFGSGSFPSGLRDYDVVNEPAEYLEEVLNLDDKKEDDENTSAAVEITVREDKVLSGESEITVEDLPQIISDSGLNKVVLIDDGAKRVTYAKVYDELERLGVIIEEK